MAWPKRMVCGLCAVLSAAGAAVAGELSSAGLRVPSASMNGGGAVNMRSESGADMFRQVDATIGQAAAIGAQYNAAGRRVVIGGFWASGGAVRVPLGCLGDCSADGTVTVDELVRGVNIALGNPPPRGCQAFDANADDTVTVDELVKAVNHALNGCTDS